MNLLWFSIKQSLQVSEKLYKQVANESMNELFFHLRDLIDKLKRMKIYEQVTLQVIYPSVNQSKQRWSKFKRSTIPMISPINLKSLSNKCVHKIYYTTRESLLWKVNELKQLIEIYWV